VSQNVAPKVHKLLKEQEKSYYSTISMSEIINTYLLDDLETVIPMDRGDFYKEQIEIFEKTGKPTRACEVVQIFIFNLNKELLVQKRSYSKKHNSGLLDKSIGGHIRYDDEVNYTVMVETVQELQTPSIVLRNEKDFIKTRELLSDYLTTIGIIKHTHSKLYMPKKLFNNKVIKIANKMHIFFGIYGGNIRPADREAQGVLFYTLEELSREMKKFPQTFTDDMHILVKDLGHEMKEFVESQIK